MPYANNNIQREEWRTCDRCGFLHPISMLKKQLGLWLCTDHGCYDDISNDRRGIIIQKLIQQGQIVEARTDWSEKQKDKGETIFDSSDD